MEVLTWDDDFDGLLVPTFVWGLGERPGELLLELLLDFWEDCLLDWLLLTSDDALVGGGGKVVLVALPLEGLVSADETLLATDAATGGGSGPIRVLILDPALFRCNVCLSGGKLRCV